MAPTSPPLLERYFERIGYHGPATPTLDVLRQLHLLHPQAIPFENIAPYSGQAVSLEKEAIAEKLITQRRGGYCFEHNSLLLAVLREIGFEVTPLMARVRWQVAAEVPTGLTHMLLRVELDDLSWFTDVAFGAITQTAPLAYELDVAQSTPHGVFRLVESDSELGLEFQTEAGWQFVYQFSVTPAVQADFEIGNWYTSTHPESLFLNTLLISRVGPDARELMVGDRYVHRDNAGVLHTRSFTDAAAWGDCLQRQLGICLDPRQAHALFQRVSMHF
ncbi:arylamine N-acetyltransferase [Delftia acidovorans]|nr:arylamine N-acetyltransferase [Delftia acidovorans]QQB53688.1 arylamine N-acetyltransferase [Delftia acidovorans]